ncbi:four-helix bundle copper-binding protein [Thiohalobacter sp. IOR34]|uniref:four-helix bundle copper-binding protein n=1 Tax=Thiohalobacter sp. IOR34 TaxID=3057176 RepID=UPI0025B24D0A|nr:four-helix bundle copper-binding protein [Thiohalobacter sp. IOR34]WJW75966.1 four-helix bundle copper-binding protein [Thiohalobacter sp. IOR34]
MAKASMTASPSNPFRRDLLKGALASGVLLASSQSLASEHMHHHAGNPHEALIDTALDCLKKGQLCIDHCMELFKRGDTSVAECADSVQEMLAMCSALEKMAAYRSDRLKAVARVCADVCKVCEKACRKHEDKHAECKACADACADCIEACEKLIRA